MVIPNAVIGNGFFEKKLQHYYVTSWIEVSCSLLDALPVAFISGLHGLTD